MKAIATICSLFLFVLSSFLCSAQTPPGTQKLNLVVSNVCEYYGQYVVTNGPLSTTLTPALANAGCVGMSVYTHYDSLQASGNIRFLEVTDDSPTPNWQKLFYVASNSKILSYYASFPFSFCDPVIVPKDTLILDSISGIAAIPNKLFVIRESSFTNNLLVFDTLSTTPVAAITLAMTPKFIDINFNRVAVVGTGLNNETILKVFNTSTLALLEDTVFNAMADNPISILFVGSQLLYMASQPGDSIINITKFNMSGNSIISSTAYNGSGAHAFAWDGTYFHFQPEFDPSGNNYDFQVFKYDPFLMQQFAVFNLNVRFHKLIYAGGGGFGYYPYMHGVPESAVNSAVIIYDHYTYMQVDSYQAVFQVDLIASDFRCPVSLEEYDDSKVKILAFPNPAGSGITIKASGLICGRDYKMDLIDMNGKTWYQKTIHAKMSVEIPLETMPSGVYILRIHTLKGMVTEKIVKE